MINLHDEKKNLIKLQKIKIMVINNSNDEKLIRSRKGGNKGRI